MKSVQHSSLGGLLTSLRRARGWSQPEFAARVGVSQQTVSRWEQGASRPRFKELPALAAILETELTSLEEAAGYTREANAGAGVAGSATYDVALPLYTLSPEVFENICTDLLARYYRSRGAMVNRFGGVGSKQDGIDIEVRGDSFVHTFQCKQVKDFGDKKVHMAVAKHQFKSDLNVLLLSNTASPGARKAISSYPAWQLWDKLDISAKFRELPMVDRRDLVDIYFPGQRRALLGELEAGPFQSPDEFFKGFVIRERYFNHAWELVGREVELTELLTNVQNDALVVSLLFGAPGNGKTRLLREVVLQMKQRRPDISVWFASSTEDVKRQHLEMLGHGLKLLIVDDAHDRDDLGQLLSYASVPENNARLLLALRPYGRTKVQSQAALAAIDARNLASVDLTPRTKEDARVLAEKVLESCGGPLDAAGEIAERTYTTPLVTVLAAQIVSRERVPVALLGNSQDFQSLVLAKLQTVIAGEIVSNVDAPKLKGVLRMVALLQPVVFDDSGFTNILREAEGLEQEDALRMLRVLTESGVLFKRGLRYRLAPDLLADDIIQRNFIDINGRVTDKVQRVFEFADAQYLKHLFVNLGRLEWRLTQGAVAESVLLSAIADKLQWHSEYHNPHIEAVEAVAYYQPRLALNFAERLIRQGHGGTPGVCGMVRNAAYNFDFLEEACLLLWRAGRSDERLLHQQPSHGVRILKELAEFAPYKPVAYVERVVNFALELLDRPRTLEGSYTPFTILEGALRTEMEDMTSNGYTLTINRYKLDFEAAKQVREQVIDSLIDSLRAGPLRRAFLAAQTLSEALRSPMHSAEDDQVWNRAHALVLRRVHRALDRPDVHPAVLMRAAQSVSWHAQYNEGSPSQPIALSILQLLDRDLPTRVTRLMVDAWGSDTWKDDETFDRSAYQKDLNSTISDLSVAFPDATSLCDFLEHHLQELSAAGGPGWGTPQIFIVKLLDDRPDLANELLARSAKEETHLKTMAGAALAVLMKQPDRRDLVSQVLDTDSSEAWELVSEAFARQRDDFFDEDDLSVIRKIFLSSNELVLLHAATIARKIAEWNPALAVELIASADLTRSTAATRDFLMWMSHGKTIPKESISEQLWERLLGKLVSLKRLDEHWSQAFLRKAVAAYPASVMTMLKARVISRKSRLDLRPPRRDHEGTGLGLLNHPDGVMLMRDFLKWAVGKQAGEDFSGSIGSYVLGLCGSLDAQVQELLLEVLTVGAESNVDVVASVLGCAHQEFVIQETKFVRTVLSHAEMLGQEAVKDISAALWAATVSGGRSGSIGEPFAADLRLKEHCESVLKGVSKLDPSHSLYSSLLDFAQENIDRQAKEKLAMQEDSDD